MGQLSLEIVGLLGALMSDVVIIAGGSDSWSRLAIMFGGTMVLGSVISSAAYSARFSAYRDAKISPRGNLLAVSWLLTALCAGLYVASAVDLATFEADESDWIQVPLGGVFLMIAAIVPAVFDAALVRVLFARELRRSEDRAALEIISVSPAVVHRDGRGRVALSPGVALSGSF